MKLAVWTYEGPPHVGAMRVATAMTGVHYLLHAPQGDTYADLLFTMIERRGARPPVTYTTAYRPSGLAVGDLNGDGRPDVAVACQGLPGDPGAVSVFLQSPTTPGLLLPAVNDPGVSGPMGVAIADMDGDGHPDLVLADGDIVVRLNSGTGTFGVPNFFYN